MDRPDGQPISYHMVTKYTSWTKQLEVEVLGTQVAIQPYKFIRRSELCSDLQRRKGTGYGLKRRCTLSGLVYVCFQVNCIPPSNFSGALGIYRHWKYPNLVYSIQ